MQQILQLTATNARLNQASQSLVLSLETVRATITKCGESNAFERSVAKYLSKVPNKLRQLANPLKELWHYFESLGYTTLISEDKMVSTIFG